MPAIGDQLQAISNENYSLESINKHSYLGLSPSQKAQYEAEGYQCYQGKVRELVKIDDFLYIFHSDRLSAFDKFIGVVPYKGAILAEISRFWFDAVKDIAPHHFLAMPNERVIKTRNCEPIKAEVIVRGYLAGSMERAYSKGQREFCGCHLEEGFTPYGKLSAPIITPTTKAAAYEHDENASPAELIAQGVCSDSEWRQIEELSLKLFARGQSIYANNGWILVDTKYEFGRDADGSIRLIDEIHTPDSSRLWKKDSYQERLNSGKAPEMLDKEIVRRYLMDQGFSGDGHIPTVPGEKLISLAKTYLHVAESLTRKQLQTNLEPSQVSL